jgi:hypothetical protein
MRGSHNDVDRRERGHSGERREIFPARRIEPCGSEMSASRASCLLMAIRPSAAYSSTIANGDGVRSADGEGNWVSSAFWVRERYSVAGRRARSG